METNKIDNLNQYRNKVRQGLFSQHTVGLFPENAQFNVVILSKSYASDFSEFCRLNPVPCPLVYQGQPGQYLFPELGGKDDEILDIRLDVPAYHIYLEGRLEREVKEITDLWKDDWVAFFIGCSFTFEYPLLQNNISLPHVQQNCNVAMYKTNIELKPSQYFSGKMVVSMRWIKPSQVEEVVRITGEYPHFHGAPIQIGSPEKIGVKDITQPDYGEFIESPSDEDDVAVFWGCGVTPQNSIQAAQLPIVITHKPGSMLISGLSHEKVLSGIAIP